MCDRKAADIDFFKKVNDTYGHLVGDQVIVAVTRTLSKRMRKNDLLCRMGGEEFCIMLPGASEATALDVAKRLSSEIEQWVGDEVGAVKGLKITSSFGVTSLKSGAESVSELVELADFALYTSKQGGQKPGHALVGPPHAQRRQSATCRFVRLPTRLISSINFRSPIYLPEWRAHNSVVYAP